MQPDSRQPSLQRTASVAEPTPLPISERLVRTSPTVTLPVSEASTGVSDAGTTECQPFQFATYLILNEIARGGMGVVYRARDTVLGREVALKMIHSGKHVTRPLVERFYQEAQAVAQLKHANIVQVFDFGVSDGQHYFTMGLAECGSMRQHLQRLQAEPRAAVAMIEKVARAVQHIHEHGLLHRDLKPGNILLDQGDEPLVSDFGLAKSLELDLELTRTGSAVGTPAYMAPEQAAGRGDEVGRHSDIWALGVILYELLCGKRPFNGESREEIIRAIQEVEPPPPRVVQPRLDRNLEAVLLKCLEKEPKLRYPSAGALADDLGSWLRGEPVRARSASPLRSGVRWLARNRGKAVAGALLIVGLLVATFVVDRFDPNRELRTLERMQEEKKAVVLIAEGDPRWSRWRLPGEAISATKTNAFAVRTAGFALLELCPRTTWSNYRFSAEVQHDPTSVLGDAGVYIAHAIDRRGGHDLHGFVSFHFADWGQAVANNTMKARVLSVFHRQPVVGPVSHHTIDPNIVRREPAAAQPIWRKLDIAVRPSGMRFYWNGAEIGALTRDDLDKAAASAAVDWEPLLGAPAEVPLHGGLGLYVSWGTASFRNVRLEPLLD